MDPIASKQSSHVAVTAVENLQDACVFEEITERRRARSTIGAKDGRATSTDVENVVEGLIVRRRATA